MVRFSVPFLNWIRWKLRKIDHWTGKLMKIHWTLHPKKDVNRVYVTRKEGCGAVSIEVWVGSVSSVFRRIYKQEQSKTNPAANNRTNKKNTLKYRKTGIAKLIKQKWEEKTYIRHVRRHYTEREREREREREGELNQHYFKCG